ncbi:claudin-11-like [Cyprinodon tularosa]|uniref:claudin-11-like n=1 Tax=Cyprinodon tularosa TaxID=77115 RepID=UPI0018E1F16C|nr:claudin-11-like [Cyprinodon tularosa]
MAHICRQLIGIGGSCAGWVGLIFATATNDWVRTCDYSVATCLRMDELGSRGLWAECVVSPSLYQCVSLDQMFSLSAYVQVSRALMISVCLLGLPALLLVLLSTPCIRLPTNASTTVKKRNTRVGGILFIIMAVFGAVATIWFPIGANKTEHLMSFGYSLYVGWAGAGLCLLSGIIILCFLVALIDDESREKSFFYSRRGGTAREVDRPSNHAKSERV